VEKSVLENGHTFVVSEPLTKLGFEEITRRGEDGVQRFVRIPNSFDQNDLLIPPSINTIEPSSVDEEGKYIRIPNDSIPLRILDTSPLKNNNIRYPGILSNINETINEIKKNNPILVSKLHESRIELKDILIVSIEQSKVFLLL
jgi:hypothetical protein